MIFQFSHFSNVAAIHPWVVYSLVGLAFAILSHREGLPMTMRSCFYPLIGDRIFGWIGDVIDVSAVISTMFGVCTSLGLGAKQFNQGLAFLFQGVSGEDVKVQAGQGFS